MTISGWDQKYVEILKDFKYSRKLDLYSAKILNSLSRKPSSNQQLKYLIKGRTVFVVGAGPSLSSSIPILKKYKKIIKIVADSALKAMVENGINSELVVTDLDGDEKILKRVGKSDSIFVVHAHGDNFEKLNLSSGFKNWIGTTQTKPFKKIQNFGGFTDGDRAVFLANHFQAKKIILFGMDFGKVIGKYSKTKSKDRKMKLRKLKSGKSLLQWLAGKSSCELFTTSSRIKGFKKITFRDLDSIIT